MRCIDPNEGMRAVFSGNIIDPRVSLTAGTFDDTSVPDGWADVVVVATVRFMALSSSSCLLYQALNVYALGLPLVFQS